MLVVSSHSSNGAPQSFAASTASSGSTSPAHYQYQSNNKVTLPPISSFDNLVRAAENQYHSNTNTNTNTRHNSTCNLDDSFSRANFASPSPSNIIPRSDSLASTDSVFSLPALNNSDISIHEDSPAAKALLPERKTPIKKSRKKKECTICHNFYANLSTHKSTHLTPENRPHKCPICNHGFARNNDLIRHKKRHWKDEIVTNTNSDADGHSSDSSQEGSLDNPVALKYKQLKSLHAIKGTFKCPFNSLLIQLDMDVCPAKSKALTYQTINCHATGVFSRCDTYKNHLKALHFEYPAGTKKIDRSAFPGKCRHCGEEFQNVDFWLKNHIGKHCGYTYH